MMDQFRLPDGKVQVSFSGGRTSAYMLHRLLNANGDVMRDEDRVQVVFANTGRERPETLDFVAECASRWQVTVTWVEWQDGANGHRFRVVGRQGASDDGEPFEALIRKRRFLPNQRFRFCTQELKVRPARDYLASLGWDRWTSAIGFRADEAHRGAGEHRERWTRWFPLIEAEVTRFDVAAFWDAQPFDLHLPHVRGNAVKGNCDGCFLKSEAHLAALAHDEPDRHAWWERMERVAGGLTSNPNGARFSKRYSRREMREFMDRQGDLALSTSGVLCQADDGECAA